MRIYLLGFMGSGKSFSGQQLAEKFNMSFVDLDEYIEKKEGQSIQSIFKNKGEDYFRKVEQASLHEMGTREMTIISTGGGTPCFFDNMDWMNEDGITVFLETHVQVLTNRLLEGMEHRPLLKDFSKEELASFIEHKLEERNPFYHQAQVFYLQKEEGQKVAEELMRYLYRVTPSP